MSTVTLPSAQSTSTCASDFFSKVVWGADYIPLVSTIKGLIDLFLTHVWHPQNLDNLPTFAKVYYHYLAEKEQTRNISLIPVVGNLIVIIQDHKAYTSKIEAAQLQRSAENGQKEAIEKLSNGTPEQKKTAIASCYQAAFHPAYMNQKVALEFLESLLCNKTSPHQKEVLNWFLQNAHRFESTTWKSLYQNSNVPTELHEKVVRLCVEASANGDFWASHYLSGDMFNSRESGKAAIINALCEKAQTGNGRTYDILISDIFQYGRNLSVSQPILSWLMREAENPSSPIHAKALDQLNSLSYTGTLTQKQSIIDFYIKMLGVGNLPQNRISKMIGRLYMQSIEAPEQKAQILNIFRPLAERGNLKCITIIADDYARQRDWNNAKHWYEKGARQGDADSIWELSTCYIKLNDIDQAIFWVEKIANRDIFTILRLRTLKDMKFAQNDAARRKAEEQARQEQQKAQQGRQNAQQQAQRTYAEQCARAKAEQAAKEAQEKANCEKELARILGHNSTQFTTLKELVDAYRAWALTGHPDKVPLGKMAEATTKFQRVGQLMRLVKEEKHWN